MFKKMISKATQKVSEVSSKAEESLGGIKDSSKVIDKYWPMIEGMLVKNFLSKTTTNLDDAALEKVLSTAYEALPAPVRLVLPKEKFIEFCLSKKGDILQKAKSTAPISLEELLPKFIAVVSVVDGVNDELIREGVKILEEKEIDSSNLAKFIGEFVVQRALSKEEFEIRVSEVIIEAKGMEDDKKEELKAIIDRLGVKELEIIKEIG
ncbi:MAG: hypothetical protein GXN91_05390 [Epsilonproteobacteria bacterium]|nr:hypothetical protein [Campylobacterota bacterium]